MAEVSEKKAAAERKVEDRKGKLEKAREKVVEEERNLAAAEKELADAKGEFMALKQEDVRRERVRREEAQRDKEPRCMDLDESGREGEVVEEEEEDGVNLEGGKKRKVVRKARASRMNIFSEMEMDKLHEFLKKLSKESKQACMRSLREDIGSVEFGEGLMSESACSAQGAQEDPIVTPSG